jgi:hypothetical protein
MDPGKIKAANINLIERHINIPVRNKWLKKQMILGLRSLFRFRMYIVRAITRGVWTPYQYTKAMIGVSTLKLPSRD